MYKFELSAQPDEYVFRSDRQLWWFSEAGRPEEVDLKGVKREERGPVAASGVF